MEGAAFGKTEPVFGEVVFNTGMSGYVETLTDPSYQRPDPRRHLSACRQLRRTATAPGRRAGPTFRVGSHPGSGARRADLQSCVQPPCGNTVSGRVAALGERARRYRHRHAHAHAPPAGAGHDAGLALSRGYGHRRGETKRPCHRYGRRGLSQRRAERTDPLRGGRSENPRRGCRREGQHRSQSVGTGGVGHPRAVSCPSSRNWHTAPMEF